MLTTTLQFSTKDVPPAERLRNWNEVFDRSISRRDLTPLTDDPFDMEVTVSNLAGDEASSTGVCVQRMTFSAGFSARRTHELLADGNDDVILYIHKTGHRTASQLGRETQMDPGGGLLVSNADTSVVKVLGPSRFACIALPRKPMKALVPDLEDLLMRSLPRDTEVLQLLEGYLSVLERLDAVNTPDLQQTVATHIHDLAAAALGAARDHREIANGRGIRAARLHTIKADIARRLPDGDVTAGGLAKRHRITPRYIHKLFETSGTTLSKFVLGQRLNRVYRMLLEERHTGRTISALAFAAGFGDLSTFNHAFRRHYGATPSDIRAHRCTTEREVSMPFEHSH